MANASEVAKATIANFELGKRTPYATTLSRLQEALTAAGVQFIAENGGGAGVRLTKSSIIQEGIKPEDLNATNDD